MRSADRLRALPQPAALALAAAFLLAGCGGGGTAAPEASAPTEQPTALVASRALQTFPLRSAQGQSVGESHIAWFGPTDDFGQPIDKMLMDVKLREDGGMRGATVSRVAVWMGQDPAQMPMRDGAPDPSAFPVQVTPTQAPSGWVGWDIFPQQLGLASMRDLCRTPGQPVAVVIVADVVRRTAGPLQSWGGDAQGGSLRGRNWYFARYPSLCY